MGETAHSGDSADDAFIFAEQWFREANASNRSQLGKRTREYDGKAVSRSIRSIEALAGLWFLAWHQTHEIGGVGYAIVSATIAPERS